MSTRSPKQFVYRYNGVESSEEVEQDFDGEMEMPVKDKVIHRKGKPWKVVHVLTEVSTSGAIPVVRVFLADGI